MIDFERLERDFPELKSQWDESEPFRLVVLDDFADAESLGRLVEEIPDPKAQALNKSRDYMFAKEKFEKSVFKDFGAASHDLYDDLISDRFSDWLTRLCERDIWIDREFHGGGIHQGGQGSFLDMHADFNAHPLHPGWFRDLNILLYLNRDWVPEYGGDLKLRHKVTGKSTTVVPVFNRCVIMETRDFTLHGYDPISFPPGQYRRSVACYAYSMAEHALRPRSTVWYPERGGILKRAVGALWPTLVRWKSRVLGSATTRNK